MKPKKLRINVSKNSELDLAYLEAIEFAKSHYENFPVLSFFVPQKIKKDVAIVYQFARQADDIADEGNFTETERIENLNKYEQDFTNSLNGKFSNPFWMALSNTIKTKNLSSNNFSKLLTAFRQDITKSRYANMEELLNYCSYSANPVGRIILELHSINDESALQYSDKICTALQITNFLQDISVDFDKQRIYLPLEELTKFNVSENIFHLKEINSNFKQMMKAQIKNMTNYFETGKNLLPFLPFGLKQQIKWTINGGEGILKKITELNYDVLNTRPKFSKMDLLKLLFQK